MLKYEGYTKVKENNRYVETWIYRCSECGNTIKVEPHKLPEACPYCGAKNG